MTDEELAVALSILERGGIVAAATETLFGLLADARRAAALDRLFAIKGRDAAKGVALLLPDRSAWTSLVVEVPIVAERLADRFWPGPLTIALAARPDLDRRLTVDETVGARWPGGSDAARIATAFGAPLTATSANLAGEPAGATDGEVQRAFARQGAALFVVPGRAPGGAPSTVVAIAGDTARVVRRGAIPESDIAVVIATSASRQM